MKHEKILEIINQAKIQHLEKLDLSNKGLEEIPHEIFELKQLKILNLKNNQIKNLPESICQLNNLTRLNLVDNQIINLPESISKLSNLTGLYLGNNNISNLPQSFAKLRNLTGLYLGENNISNLSECLAKLRNLAILYLGNNNLSNLPEWLFNLTNLILLDLSGNNIRNLSESISNLTNLTGLYLRDNPLESPPLEIANKGIEAIREYFEQLKKEGIDYVYEAKLLILGEAGAGKTTLSNKILDSNYQLKDEDSTQGIEVKQWDFPLPEGKNFRVNIWDFGGQEIYHNTHQFFLTKRSLYCLVSDNRKEDTDFYYWLNIVELLSQNSPLLIIQNEKQNRKTEINEKALRGRFTNLKKTLSTNLANNEGLSEILTQIKHYITNLPHVGDDLPQTWKRVREVLEKDSRNYISLEEYLSICEENGFTKYKDKLQLSGYLHDLGICLHFQDDPLLKKTIILKPEWGTAAVYKVLDNDQVIDNYGRFSKENLLNIWHEEKYINMEDELLQLMMKFQLCYKIPDNSDTYIAPQLLTKNQPEYPWNENNNLILRYEYDFMPKGIITRFIVNMHKYIYQPNYVWRNGVILKKDETFAEVIEDYNQKHIKIRVEGKYKKEFIIIIIDRLDEIHDSYQELKYSKLIPCNCIDCKNTQNPHFYKFEKLQQFKANGKYKIQCYESAEMVNVLSLIDDVIGINYSKNEEITSRNNHFSALTEAIENYRKKIGQFEKELAITSNPELKFELKNRMAECKKEIKRLENEINWNYFDKI